MGFMSKLAETVYLGCRPRTFPVEEVKDYYDDNRRAVIPIAQKVIVATNECGEQVIILSVFETSQNQR
jgi:hypothetical protein